MMGLKPDPKEPIGFGPADSKEGQCFYDLSWGGPILTLTAILHAVTFSHLLYSLQRLGQLISNVWKEGGG